MKKILFFLSVFSLFTFASCRHLNKAQKSDVVVDKGNGTDGGSGTSFEDAVVVHEKNGTDGVAAEYEWLKLNYPGYSLIKQTLEYNTSVPYDVMEIKTADGTKKKIYFDISEYFGKF
ncbi:MAG TPA: hypothetical protein VL651_09140 [Bacteroidia bacterium]|nr:hypothetical protein [Bacteroidia bacterium]